MKLSFKTWTIFVSIAILSLWVWYKTGYSRFIFVDLSVDKQQAFIHTKAYLASSAVDTKEYKQAAIFDEENWDDRYLQKTLGLKGEEEFLKTHNYELFSWKIRFFKELEKEEFIFRISPMTGRLLAFEHKIEDTEFRDDPGKEFARKQAEEFLTLKYGFNPSEYDFHKEEAKRYDNRTDYSFSWEKKGVYIPWRKDEGGAKLLSSVTISGKEVREFYINKLEIPDKFSRYIENQLVFGEYLFSFSFLLIAVFLISAVLIVIKKRTDVIVRACRRPFIYLSVFLALISVVYILNDIQDIFIDYPTSVNLNSYIWLYLIRVIINTAVLSAVFLFPGLAGEYLRNKEFRDKTYSSLQHYFKSTFYSRSVAKSIILGYLLFFIMLGLQQAIFSFGQKYFGVWKEWSSFTRFSSAYFPFLSAVIIGISASLNEEIIFRVFGISWAKRYLKNTILAVIFSSLVWGFGHSRYAIFPVWFRGIEVSSIGLLFGFIFLRYGIIPLLTAHYLFDCFWGVAPYIFAKTPANSFFSSIFVLLLPLIFSVTAFFINREEKETETAVMFDETQEYNLEILKVFVAAKKRQGFKPNEIRKELIRHNWDEELVDSAISE